MRTLCACPLSDPFWTRMISVQQVGGGFTNLPDSGGEIPVIRSSSSSSSHSTLRSAVKTLSSATSGSTNC